MAKWISLKKAAYKYGVDEKDVHVWAKVGEIASVATETTYIVDDESIKEFLSRTQVLPTREYIQNMRQAYENQCIITDSLMEIISMQQQELDLQEKEITLRKQMNDSMQKHNEQLKEIIHR